MQVGRETADYGFDGSGDSEQRSVLEVGTHDLYANGQSLICEPDGHGGTR
jgi:hypothetical protein